VSQSCIVTSGRCSITERIVAEALRFNAAPGATGEAVTILILPIENGNNHRQQPACGRAFAGRAAGDPWIT
jgi:hypothetical protein